MESADYFDKKFARTSNIVSRKIASKHILVPIRQRARDVESIYNMNEVASRIWELIDGERRLTEIRDAIVEEFEVEQDEAESDLVELIKQLEEIDAVKEV